jgi:hypothetical protein
MAHVAVTGPHDPTEPGALEGYHLSCSDCGPVGSSSLKGIADRDARDHEAWHGRREAEHPTESAFSARHRH